MDRFKFVVLASCAALANACQEAAGWDLPAPERTDMDPDVGVYDLSPDGSLAVRCDGRGKKHVVFSRDGSLEHDIPLERGAFTLKWGDIGGTHCPTDSFAISGAFVGARRAEGIVKYASECAIESERKFVARLPSAEIEPGQVGDWLVKRTDTELQIHHASECGTRPQYAALHTDSGYFRLNSGPDSSWGTSAILPPVFWSGGKLLQGAAVETEWKAAAEALEIAIEGHVGGLSFTGTIVLSPPGIDAVSAAVTMQTSGDIVLDERASEAFKLATLSSMHISERKWDADAAFVDAERFAIPGEMWILPQPKVAASFGLVGGSSDWQPNTPTIEVVLDTQRDITGWVTPSNDPNDDNVGMWAAADVVERSWSYTLTARAAQAD